MKYWLFSGNQSFNCPELIVNWFYSTVFLFLTRKELKEFSRDNEIYRLGSIIALPISIQKYSQKVAGIVSSPELILHPGTSRADDPGSALIVIEFYITKTVVFTYCHGRLELRQMVNMSSIQKCQHRVRNQCR